MSVEVFLYSERREVVERSLLKRQLEQEGWKSLFLASWPDVQLVSEGPCVDDLIVGCKLSTDLMPIQDLIQEKDLDGIEQLLGEECFANCALSTECPYEFSATYHGEELYDLIRELGSEPVEAMKRVNAIPS